MKKIFSNKQKFLIGAFLITMGILASCKKLIQIPTHPPGALTTKQVFADSATTLTAVAGVYSLTAAGGAGLPFQDSYFTVATSLSANEITYTGKQDHTQFSNYASLTPLNSLLNPMWVGYYKEIYQVNDILNNITGNTNLSVSFIKQITGEMKFVRAFCYFNLVNLFGGVPLVTTTDHVANARLPRAAAAVVYTQILTDLSDAVQKLPQTYPSAGHTRPNLYTALALKAKVNLYLGQWQAAYNASDSVIKHGNFSLAADLNKVFLDGSNEAIWQVPFADRYQGSGEAGMFVPSRATTIPNYIITDSLLDQFETGDLRKAKWLGVNVVNSKNIYYPFKYKSKQKTSPETDYMLLRFAEMYLIRAEAGAQLNTAESLTQAVSDLNTIRLRAGIPHIAPSSQAAVLAAVRKEWRTEMFTEFGSRWFELNRTSTDAKYPSTGQAAAVLIGWQSFNALYPIPETQISLNNTLKQNPGYQ